ncbi:MAG: zinc metallopeptidase [Clostridium sp.]|nr:zinc metallopeptidase [Clostridium sp.]MCI7442148.1 zinc metallopeptidase [Clostridium sp.]
MFYYDSTMLILIPAVIISFIAQMQISRTYSKYKSVGTRNGYTGQQVARMMLDEAGLFDIQIQIINQELGDHYSPSERILRLSPDVYNGSSVAAAGIAAHEVGHAIQHKESYKPIVVRNAILPIVNIGSSFSWIVFFLGLVLGISKLTTIGIILFSWVVVFQLITLPVEFNASSRALSILKSRNILYEDEAKGAKKVLKAAAMTYVAAVLHSISQLIRLLVISNRNDD